MLSINMARVSGIAKCVRWGFASIAVLVVAVRIGMFINAATTEASLSEICVSADRANGKTLLIPSSQGASIAEAEQMPGLRSYTVKHGDFLWANAVSEPVFTTLPRDLRDRIRLAYFSAVDDGGQIRLMGSVSEWECRIKASDAGIYYIIAYLPPVSLPTNKSETINIGKFMRQNGEGGKCVAVKIIVSGASDGKTKPTEIWEKDKRPVLDLCQPEKKVLETVKPIIPMPTLEPMPHTNPESEYARRDMGEKKDGVENANDEAETKTDNNVESSLQPIEIKRVPPVNIIKREKILTAGTLPETIMQFDPNEIKALNAREWLSICEEYDMRFVCSPADDSTRPAAGKFIVMAPDGSKVIMEFEDVRSDYGIKIFKLDQLSNSVVENTGDRFDDPVEWYFATKIRGFLINNLLLQAIDDAVQDRSLAKTDLQKIKEVKVNLRVVVKPSGKSIVVDVLDVVLTEGMEGERHRESREGVNE